MTKSNQEHQFCTRPLIFICHGLGGLIVKRVRAPTPLRLKIRILSSLADYLTGYSNSLRGFYVSGRFVAQSRGCSVRGRLPRHATRHKQQRVSLGPTAASLAVTLQDEAVGQEAKVTQRLQLVGAFHHREVRSSGEVNSGHLDRIRDQRVPHRQIHNEN